MVNQKLAALLATAVMLGQTSLVATLFAQADTKIPFSYYPVKQPESLQVASVIQHTDINTASDAPLSGTPRPIAPDIFTIGNGAGKLSTIVQVLPQDGNITSLFVNGTEILRFKGTVEGQSAYSRVKAIASQLNRVLVTEPDAIFRLHPAIHSEDGQKEAVIQLDDEVLTVIDAQTAKMTQETQPKLAFLYTNRLRQALGEAPLEAKAFSAMTVEVAKAEPTYQSTGRKQNGMASWYGGCFHGRRAADGSRFNMNALTAAHRTLPFGTVVKVINQRTKKSCYVKITDRGPFAHGRIIDLSRGAAKAIGMLGSGVARVSVEVVHRS